MGNTGIAKCCSIFVLNWFAPASAGVPPGPCPKAFRFELPLFCPLESCSHYQKPDNTIKKDGLYRTQSDPIPRQMYYCSGGGHRFSETHYSELKHKQGSMKEYEQTAKLSCYGLSSEQIADVLDRDVRTIEHWLSGLGKKK